MEWRSFNSITTEFTLVILLLYDAEDTIFLVGTAFGLQFAFDELQTYCDKWKLVVNQGKTKQQHCKQIILQQTGVGGSGQFCISLDTHPQT